MTDIGYSLGDAYGKVIISTNVGEAMDQAARQFDAGIAGMSASLQSWGAQLTQMGAQLTVLTTPLRGVISTGLEVAGDFDQIMTEIQARTGSTVEDMDKIRSEAERLGAESVFSAQQAGEAILQLLTSGMDLESALATLPAVINAATADSAELGRTADVVTNILSSFGLEASDAEAVVNSLARASGASKASITTLGQGFASVGNAAKEFGLTFDQTAAILGIFSNNGIQGSEAGTQLRSMLTAMTSDAKPTVAAWKTLGVSMYDAQGNMRDLNVVFAELDAALDKLPMQEQNRLTQDLAGSYGRLGFAALRSGMTIDEMQAKMQEQADASEIAAQMMGTWNNLINSLRGSWEMFLTRALAPTVEEYLKPIINAMIDMVNSMADWVKANPEIAQTFVILGMAIAALGPILLGMGLALSVAGGAIGLLMSPIALVSAGIFTLAVVFRNQISSIVASLTAFAVEASRPINNFLSKINQVITHFNFLRTSGSQFFDALRSEIVYFSDSLLMFFGITGEAADEIQQSLLTAVTSIETMFSDVGNIIRVGLDNFTRLSEEESSIFHILRTEINVLTPMIMNFLGITEETADAIQVWLWEAVEGVEALFAGIGRIIPTFQRWLSTLGRHIGDAVSAFIYLRDQGSNIFSTLNTMITWNLRGFLELIGITGEAASNVQVFLIGAVNALQTFVGQVSQSFSDLQADVENFWESLSGATPDGFISDLMAASGAADLLQSTLTTLQSYAEDIGDTFATVSDGLGVVATMFRVFRAMGYSVFGAVAKEIELFSGTILGMFGITGEFATAIQGWLVTAVLNVERLFNAVGGVLGSVWNWLSSLWSQIGTIDLSGLKQLLGPLYEAASWLLSWGNPFWMAFMVLKTLGVDFVQLIEDVAKGISTFFDTLAKGGSLGDAFGAVFGPDVVNAVTQGIEIAQRAVQDFIDLLVGIWDFVSPALTNLGNWFLYDVLPAIGDVIFNSVLPALQDLADFLGELWAIVSPHLEAFADWFLYTILPEIQRFISDVIIPAIGDLIDVLRRIWNDVSPFLLQLADWFLTDVLPTILSFINEVVIPVIQDFIDILVSIWEIVSPVLESLYNWFISEGLPFIMEQLELGRQAVQTFIDILAGIWGFVEQGVELLKSGLDAAIKWIDTNVVQPVMLLVQGIIDLIAGIWNGVQKGVEDFKTGLQAMVSWVDTNIVQPVVNGVNGIINAFKGIWAAVQGAVNDFKNGVQGVLDGITKAITDVMVALGLAEQKEKQVGQNTQADMITRSPEEADAIMRQMYIDAGLPVPEEYQASPPPVVVSNGGGGLMGNVPYLGPHSTGSDYIQKTGMALLHEGEAVLTKQENADRREGGGKPTIHIENLYATTIEEARAVARTLKEEFAEEMTFNG